jgi:hypothetical protein
LHSPRILLPAVLRVNMFLVTEADADAIRAIFNKEGELSAAIELRRRFPGITDTQRHGYMPGRLPDGSRCRVHRARLSS